VQQCPIAAPAIHEAEVRISIFIHHKRALSCVNGIAVKQTFTSDANVSGTAFQVSAG
jgi:hypothetical protein